MIRTSLNFPRAFFWGPKRPQRSRHVAYINSPHASPTRLPTMMGSAQAMTRNTAAGVICPKLTSLCRKIGRGQSANSCGQASIILENPRHMMSFGRAGAAISASATLREYRKTATISTEVNGTSRHTRCTSCPIGRGTGAKAWKHPCSSTRIIRVPSCS